MANRQQQQARQPAGQVVSDSGFYQHKWEQFTEEHPKWKDMPEHMRPYMAVDANTGLVHAYECPPEMIRRDEKSGEIMNVARTIDQVLPWIPYMTYMPEFDRKANGPRTWMDIKTPQRVQLVKDWKKPLVSRFGIAKYNKEDDANNKKGGGGNNRNANNNARGNNNNNRNANNNSRGNNNNGNNRRGNNNNNNDDDYYYDDGGNNGNSNSQQKTNVAELLKDFEDGEIKVIKRTIKFEQQGETLCPEAVAYCRALDIRCVECILPHIARLFPDDIDQEGKPIPTTADMVRRDMWRIYSPPKNKKGVAPPNPDNRPWKIKGQIILKSAWPDFIRETCIKRAELNPNGGWDLFDVTDLQEKFDLLERQNVACVPVAQPNGAEAFETGGWGANQFITDIVVLPGSATVTIANDFIAPEGMTINYCSSSSSSSSSAPHTASTANHNSNNNSLSNQEKSEIERKFMAAHNDRIAGQVNKRKAEAIQLTGNNANNSNNKRQQGQHGPHGRSFQQHDDQIDVDDGAGNDDNDVDVYDNDDDGGDGGNGDADDAELDSNF